MSIFRRSKLARHLLPVLGDGMAWVRDNKLMRRALNDILGADGWQTETRRTRQVPRVDHRD